MDTKVMSPVTADTMAALSGAPTPTVLPSMELRTPPPTTTQPAAPEPVKMLTADYWYDDDADTPQKKARRR
jgi:hypothetical protein